MPITEFLFLSTGPTGRRFPRILQGTAVKSTFSSDS
jgi:hypothetical protein